MTPFYRVGAGEDVWLERRYRVRVPRPGGVQPGGLAVFSHVAAEDLLHGAGDGPGAWMSRPVGHDEATDELFFHRDELHPEGNVFGTVQGRYRPTPP